jgi:hypothetical protein
MERARTRNISRDGALLEGVKGQVRPGDLVVVRCEENTGRFRVVWKQDAERGAGKVLGLVRVETPGRKEDSDLPMLEPDDYQRPRVQVRRQHPRYQCEIAAELRMKGAQIPMWVTSVNLSESGCAVETVVAVPNLTDVKVTLWLDEVKIWAQGVVVTSQYGFGTGIKFTSISRQDSEYLKEFLARATRDISDRRAEAGQHADAEVGQEVHFRPGLDNVSQPAPREDFAICVPVVLAEEEEILG